jgi:hypothetical protein
MRRRVPAIAISAVKLTACDFARVELVQRFPFLLSMPDVSTMDAKKINASDPQSKPQSRVCVGLFVPRLVCLPFPSDLTTQDLMSIVDQRPQLLRWRPLRAHPQDLKRVTADCAFRMLATESIEPVKAVSDPLRIADALRGPIVDRLDESHYHGLCAGAASVGSNACSTRDFSATGGAVFSRALYDLISLRGFPF